MEAALAEKPETTVDTTAETPVVEAKPVPPLVVMGSVNIIDPAPEKAAEASQNPTIVAGSLIDIADPAISASLPAPEPEKVCNCAVAVKGRGSHAKGCAKYKPWIPPTKKPPETISSVAGLLTPTNDGAKVDYTLIASVVFDMGTNGLAMGLGPEWQPQNPQERELVVSSLAKYFESREVKDIPPGVMLALVIGIYSLPRLNKPSTAGKIRVGWAWVKEKFRRKPKALKVVES